MSLYSLGVDGKTPVKCEDMAEWAKQPSFADRVVAKTRKGTVLVSTVFLGIDHSSDNEKPLLFETMIFNGEHDQKMWRYSTWEEAEAGHQIACEIVGIR